MVRKISSGFIPVISRVRPVLALLSGSAFLFVAGGINGLILPVRGSVEGFSGLSLGLLGTGWALGFVFGCLAVPILVSRVGHVRSFSVMAAMASISVLLTVMLIEPIAWILLRAVSGFAFAGSAMIVESWLNERSDAHSRGEVFGFYMMVILVAGTMGQLSLMLGDPNTFHFFVLAAIFYCLALLPTAISSSTAPTPLVKVRLDVKALWHNSPVSVVAVFLIGMSNSAFVTLGPVYAHQTGLDLVSVSLFFSVPILVGAAAQIPVGYLSDHTDRRWMLIAVTIVAMASDSIFIILQPDTVSTTILAVSLFGAAIYSLYPIAVAHANDHALPNDYIRTSGGLLLLFGIGSVLGPLVAGFTMSKIGSKGLFVATIVPHALILGFTSWRLTQRDPVSDRSKTDFVTTLPLTMTTQAAVLSNPEPNKTQ